MDVIPELGQQAVLLTSVGWHDGTQSLRRSIPVGGNSALLPRGYDDVTRRGRYFNGASFAWRTPRLATIHQLGAVGRGARQLILEAFVDTRVSATRVSQKFSENNTWYTSAGIQVHSSWLIWRVTMNPGISGAYRFDGDGAGHGLR